jgi:predicted metal-dependent HD superfamily phosphohydrolase
MNARDLPSAVGPLPAGLAPPRGVPDAFWQALLDGYDSPPRHYHTIDHVVEVARWYQVVAREPGWTRPREVFLAVLFHDVVYDAGAKDNERRSAAVAVDAVRRWLDPDTESNIDTGRIVQLIELTARHGSLSAGDVDAEAALFLDCDMAVLGAPADAYARYEQGVAAEYLAVYPPALYAQGRQRFLHALLARERIYLSPFFHGRLEDQARANLRGALARA